MDRRSAKISTAFPFVAQYAARAAQQTLRVLRAGSYQLDAVYLDAYGVAPQAEQASSRAKSESLYAQLVVDHNLARLQEEGRWLQEVIHHIEAQSDFEGQHLPSIATEAGEEAQTLAPDPTLTRAYGIFEERLAGVTEALATYHRQLDLAWQTYEQQTVSRGGDGERQEARRRYQQRVREIRQAYEAAVRSASDSERYGPD